MHPSYYIDNPFRRPQWRAERAIALADRRPTPGRPRRYDDTYVRAYVRFLGNYMAADEDEDLLCRVYLSQPAIYRAHLYVYHPDAEWRQILEARLLTTDSLEDIAKRMATTPQTVEYYEKLFFNVRDRMENRDWLMKIVLGPAEARARNKNDVMTQDQRGFLYRLFAYYGGSVALDAMLSGMSTLAMPRTLHEAVGWFDEALSQLVRIRATMAARVFEVNRDNVMQLLEIAIGAQNADKAAKAALGSSTSGDFGEMAEKILGRVSFGMLERRMGNFTPEQQRFLSSAVEPRAIDQFELSNGNVPTVLAQAHETIELPHLAQEVEVATT